jgi:YHS domain-containing protein
MKSIAAAAVALMVGVGICVAGAQNQAGDKAAGAQVVKKQTVCPVMDEAVNTNIYLDVKGSRIYFCCMDCPAQFKKDPAKYLAKLEKSGVTLDKTPTETRKESGSK